MQQKHPFFFDYILSVFLFFSLPSPLLRISPLKSCIFQFEEVSLQYKI